MNAPAVESTLVRSSAFMYAIKATLRQYSTPAFRPDGDPTPEMLAYYIDKPLSHTPCCVLRELLSQKFVTKDHLYDAIWGHREDGGPSDLKGNLGVQVWRIRRALRPEWKIANRHGFGYRLERVQ